jgi:hypothetical protein
MIHLGLVIITDVNMNDQTNLKDLLFSLLNLCIGDPTDLLVEAPVS